MDHELGKRVGGQEDDGRDGDHEADEPEVSTTGAPRPLLLVILIDEAADAPARPVARVQVVVVVVDGSRLVAGAPRKGPASR